MAIQVSLLLQLAIPKVGCVVCWKESQSRSGPVYDIANFLAELYEEGYQASSMNSFRFAISSVHNRVDVVATGKHPMICHVLKGAFNAMPPLPRNTATWNVQTILNYLEGLGTSASLSRKFLTFKLGNAISINPLCRSSSIVAGLLEI